MPGQPEHPRTERAEQDGSTVREIACEAYIYGYPLVLMDVTKRVATNVRRSGEDAAPINQLGNKSRFPDDTFRTVVSPNADTLYSFAFLDLAEDAMVLSVPDTGNRYYLMQLLDAWTNVFASPGTRTTGNGKGDFAITGPGWSGKLPAGVKQLASPTNMVWMIGRTQTNGKADYDAVHAIQKQYRLTPLRSWGADYQAPVDCPIDPNVDMETPPVVQVDQLRPEAFLQRLNDLMSANPPSAEDAEALKRFASIGVGPGQQFELSRRGGDAADLVAQGVAEARKRIHENGERTHGVSSNGWQVLVNAGRYGTDYLWRATVALIGLGANLPEDAVYPVLRTDGDGRQLSGANRYELRFAKGQLPPVRAFWSVTLYDNEQFFVKNPINRYAIGDRDKLTQGDDGSVTIYLQNEWPGKEKETNWLPAPKDGFNLLMRLYWPRQEILNGTWKPPILKRTGKAGEMQRATTAGA